MVPKNLTIYNCSTKCLRAGALRAAYIMGWLSAAESLRSKFAVMAERNRQAGNVLTQAEKREKAGVGTDFGIRFNTNIGKITSIW